MEREIVLIAAAVLTVGVGGVILFLRSGRSRLIRLQNETEKARVQLDLLLEERQKQLPKLIETCRSYLSGEEALPALVKARALLAAQRMSEAGPQRTVPLRAP